MADYFTSTVVQQDIPERLITPLERLLLGAMLDSDEPRDGTIYYFADNGGARSDITINRRALEDALSISQARSRSRPPVAGMLAKANPESEDIDLDFSAPPFQEDAYIVILQDIVRRSKGELPHVTIAAAYTCSKMRPDGFGGTAIAITPRRVLRCSTYDFLYAFETRQERKRRKRDVPS
jgi:hypothetical protein